MKLKMISITAFLCASFLALATDAAASDVTATVEKHIYKTIHARELKSWLENKKPIVIVDARPKKYDEGEVLPGAKFLPYDSDEKLIAEVLPSKQTTIVVYCASIKCPASEYLSEKLVEMGYDHVYRYPEGMTDWIKKGYPMER